MKRRAFSRTIAGVATSGLLSAKAATAKPGANDKIVIASMGMGGRGTKIASGFEALDGVEIKAVFDVDQTRAAAAALAVGKVNGRTIGHGQDFRKILEDPEIDALTITCSNHWHGPAAVMATYYETTSLFPNDRRCCHQRTFIRQSCHRKTRRKRQDCHRFDGHGGTRYQNRLWIRGAGRC